ncbi:MAG: hypothetical protein JO002_13530, partial [Burkholderiaceae bacterium]|nr:hypothetical protein [Burkholderiaceae bacterium]
MNQYFYCVMFGLFMTNMFHTRDLKKVGKSGWPEHISLEGNFGGVSFAVSFFLVFLLTALSSIKEYDLIFCVGALLAEGFNFKWRDYRSSAYAAHVGLITILTRVWHADTMASLTSAAAIGAA